MSHGRHFVRSVARAMAVLHAFSADRPELTLSEAAKATGLDRATARRLLLTLTELGYLTRHNRLFRLAPRTMEVGRAYLAGQAKLAEDHQS
ncbi:helix-turn-helix domain-containing protein [Amycolatopsis magusensis]|uniref:DNA-binding IclR family transcriptional regulator n=1 Tax=Amycolatopsis magusensis TaxID=882444 RepID=A0ABS4PJS3_9PSEU|nr:helix-turn-helix domain-containing protein [Amycolatopsis magusensis]MBP2179079.1 DNA-binding IclR family transcriptional regulator [Amycolatopsis magusensis]